MRHGRQKEFKQITHWGVPSDRLWGVGGVERGGIIRSLVGGIGSGVDHGGWMGEEEKRVRNELAGG